ncbi:retrovirus-related pol polyprotein from transposon TNT 1-94 [Tanacetum coccineum]
MLSSIGEKPFTSASGSQPSGNTKKDKIWQTPSSTQKNKVEAHPRKVDSSLKNKDCVVKPKGTAHMQHSKPNANSELKCVKYIWRPTGRTFTIVGNACPLTRIITTTKVPLRKPTALENETPKHVVTLVYSRKPRKSKTNVPVSKYRGSIVSDVPSSSLDDYKSSKLFSVTFKNDHVAKILGYGDYQIRNVTILRVYYVEGLGYNLFSLDTVLFRGLLKLKFEKDYLCFACAMGKSKKKPHKPKSEDTNQEKLYLLRMDLCVPMHVASINGKKYILVIVDDYSRFTWVKFLRIRTDNGTDFVNQTLGEYYEKVDISHETSVAHSPQQNAHSPQQNGVVERYFDELTTMASKHSSLGPALHEMTLVTISSRLVPNPPPSTSFVLPSRTDWDILFHLLFDELLNPPSSVDHPAPEVIAPIAKVVAPKPATSTGLPSSTNVDQDAQSLSHS